MSYTLASSPYVTDDVVLPSGQGLFCFADQDDNESMPSNLGYYVRRRPGGPIWTVTVSLDYYEQDEEDQMYDLPDPMASCFYVPRRDAGPIWMPAVS